MNFSKETKIGLVGIGEHMIENLIPAIKTIENVKITGIVSRSIQKQYQLQSRFGIPDSYKTTEDMLSNKCCDIIICSGPPDFQEKTIFISFLFFKNIDLT